MAETATPTFNITREQIASFVKDPRTVRDIEAFIRMVREQLPSLLFAKVDESRQVLTDGTLTGGGDLSADRTLGINITAETERIQDVIGASLTDTATIDFTYVDATGLITADLKNTSVTAGSYGDASHIASFTVDAQGRLTSASNVAISVTGATTANALTMNNGGSGAASGSTFDGSAAKTISYNTIGAAATGAANTFSAKQTLSGGADVTPETTPTTTAVGYLGSPINTQNGAYTTVMSDAGKTLYHTSGSAHTWTIDSNANVAYPIGTILTFINENGGGNVTLAITSDTLRWGSGTGSRTLAANGTASAIKVASTTWRLTGDGIT